MKNHVILEILWCMGKCELRFKLSYLEREMLMLAMYENEHYVMDSATKNNSHLGNNVTQIECLEM